MSALTPRIDRLEKNYLINGAFDYFQNGGASGSANISTTPAYAGADQFLVSYTGTVTGTPNVSRSGVASAGGLPNLMTPYAHRFVAQRNASGLTLRMEQRLEGIEARKLAFAGFASHSLQVRSPIAGTQIRLTLNVATVLDDFTAVTQIYQHTHATIPVANTWTKLAFPAIPISPNAVNGLALVVEMIVPSGTDGSTNNYLSTQMMLNPGQASSEFTRAGRNEAEELILIQRHFEKSYDVDTNPGTASNSSGAHITLASTAGDVRGVSYFKVRKRTTPVVHSYSTTSGTIDKTDNNGTDRTSGYDGVGEQSMCTASGGNTSNTDVRWQWTADARL